jgi:hypothetical protein
MSKAILFTDLKNSSLFQKLYEWESPERYWFPKTRSWVILYSLFFVLIIFIGVLLKEYIFIIAVIAFTFLWFIQGLIPPETRTHTITSLGVKTFDKLYRWRLIKHFWISEKNDTKFLHLEVVEDDNPTFVKRLSLLLNPGDEIQIFDILIKFLDYGDKNEVGFNIFTEWLQGKYFEMTYFMKNPDLLDLNTLPYHKLNAISLDEEDISE